METNYSIFELRYVVYNGFTSYQDITNELGLLNNKRFKTLIYFIRTRRKYRYITSKYDFT